MRLRLHIVPAQGEPHDRLLDGESLVVGRSSEVDLVIADRFLSRHHSRIYRADGEVWVEDLGSRNGTLLNGRPVTGPRRLQPGDKLKLSGSMIVLHDDDATASPEDGHSDGTIFLSASELLDRQDKQEPADTGRLRTETELRRYAERLKVLNDVHRALGTSLDLDKLLEMILDRVFDHLQPEQGAIFLKKRSKKGAFTAEGDLKLAAGRALRSAEEVSPASSSLASEVVGKGMAAVVTDVSADERFAAAQSMVGAGIRSFVAAPLLAPGGPLGMIVLSSRMAMRRFTEDDLELLVSLASVAALTLRNFKLTEEVVERRRLEKELALGRRIQQALLPERLPELEGYALYADNIPSRGVSGDYYQVLARPEYGDCMLMIADVAGKGVGASLVTASLEALAAGPIEDGLLPDTISRRLTRQLGRRTPPEKYATAFMASLELATGVVRYTNAGHTPGLVLRYDGAVEHLNPNGLPLGLVPEETTYGLGENSLAPGDALLLYTDGLTEAVDPDDEEYGVERLVGTCIAHCDAPPEELAAAIGRDLEAFARGEPFPDDRTLVVLRRM